jgi:hypothetical protein
VIALARAVEGAFGVSSLRTLNRRFKDNAQLLFAFQESLELCVSGGA